MFRRSDSRSLFRHLFLQPKLTKTKDWEKPDSNEQYHRILEAEGFIVPERWKEHNLSEYPTIIKDLAVLEKYLLPVFLENHQKATYHEDLYYRNQRTAIFSLFLVILLSAISFFISSDIQDSVVAWYVVGWNIYPDFGLIRVILSVCIAVLATRAAFFVFLLSVDTHNQKWVQYRGLAEELRTIYYAYLLRLNRYSTSERLQELRREVLEIQLKEQQYE